MDVQFGIKPKFVVFDLISPPLVQILPALDKDNGLDTISYMTKEGNAFTNAVPCYLHFTKSTKNLS